jgi:protein-disulfide isomerase
MLFALLVAVVFSFPVRSADQSSGQILMGAPDAPIRIEVFSDFECPSCRELYLDVMRRVVADYSSQSKVCLIYHEYPLKSHKYSRDAAMYAEAVARLGRQKLLMIYDVLFMDQAQWAQDGNLERSLAKALTKTELLKVKKMMMDPSINAAVEREIKLGQQQRPPILSTPTWFVHVKGKQPQRVEGRMAYIGLKQFIDRN